MAYLRFSCSKLSKQLGDRASFDASAQERVEILRTGGDVYELSTARVYLRGALEAKGNDL